MSTNQDYEIEKVGIFTPKSKDVGELNSAKYWIYNHWN